MKRYSPKQHLLGKGVETFGVWSDLSKDFVAVSPGNGKPPVITMTMAQARAAADRLNKALEQALAMKGDGA